MVGGGSGHEIQNLTDNKVNDEDHQKQGGKNWKENYEIFIFNLAHMYFWVTEDDMLMIKYEG